MTRFCVARSGWPTVLIRGESFREQFLHHALLELAGFGELRLQRGDLRVHVGEDGGDGGLFSDRGMGKQMDSMFRGVDR